MCYFVRMDDNSREHKPNDTFLDSDTESSAATCRPVQVKVCIFFNYDFAVKSLYLCMHCYIVLGIFWIRSFSVVKVHTVYGLTRTFIIFDWLVQKYQLNYNGLFLDVCIILNTPPFTVYT